jgi:Protein of unknown function, DUF488
MMGLPFCECRMKKPCAKNPGARTAGVKNLLTIFTIGHSTRPIGEFIELLQSHGVAQILDIRTIPKSRRNPQFNTDALADSLLEAGIRSVHLKDLGGLRHPRPDSINLGWRNASFRGYADYMLTPEFAVGLDRAIGLAAERPTALMCAEAVPWRCHRSPVSDALIVRGIRVLEIISAAPPQETRTHAVRPRPRHPHHLPRRSGFSPRSPGASWQGLARFFSRLRQLPPFRVEGQRFKSPFPAKVGGRPSQRLRLKISRRARVFGEGSLAWPFIGAIRKRRRSRYAVSPMRRDYVAVFFLPNLGAQEITASAREVAPALAPASS